MRFSKAPTQRRQDSTTHPINNIHRSSSLSFHTSQKENEEIPQIRSQVRGLFSKEKKIPRPHEHPLRSMQLESLSEIENFRDESADVK